MLPSSLTVIDVKPGRRSLPAPPKPIRRREGAADGGSRGLRGRLMRSWSAQGGGKMGVNESVVVGVAPVVRSGLKWRTGSDDRRGEEADETPGKSDLILPLAAARHVNESPKINN